LFIESEGRSKSALNTHSPSSVLNGNEATKERATPSKEEYEEIKNEV
jgi:hypothetical protein